MAAIREIAASGRALRQRCLSARSIIASMFGVGAHTGKARALCKGIAAVIIATIAISPATAQQIVSNGGTVVVPPLPGYEAPGTKFGEFLLRSQVSSGIIFDSNILREHSPALKDYIFFTAPSFNLTRTGINHTQNVVGAVSAVKYGKYGANDYTNISLRGTETYQFSPTSRIIVTGSIEDGYERRVSSNYEIPTNAASPIHQRSFTENIGYRKSWANADIGATTSFTQMRFDDVLSVTGDILNQTDRNEDDTAFEAFLNVRHSNRLQSNLTFNATHAEVHNSLRNVDTLRLAGTVTVNLTSKTNISFLAAVSEQDYYNNPDAQITPLPEYVATLTWSPMQRLTFTARGGYNKTGIDFERGIDSGGISRRGSLDASYLIWRNLQFVSSLNYDKTHLSGGQGVQTSLGGQATLTYEFSPHASVSFLYSLQNFDATSEDFTSYNENLFQASLNWRF